MSAITKINVLKINHYIYQILTDIQYLLIGSVLSSFLSLIFNDKKIALAILPIIGMYYLIKAILIIISNYVNLKSHSNRRFVPSLCIFIGTLLADHTPSNTYISLFVIISLLLLILKQMSIMIFDSLITIEHSDFTLNMQSPTYYLSLLDKSVKNQFFVSNMTCATNVYPNGSSSEQISVTYAINDTSFPPTFTVSHHFSNI